MNPADVIWRLVAAGVLVGPAIDRACEVLEIDKRDLKAARARYETPVESKPVAVPVVSIPRLGISSDISREESPAPVHTSPTTAPAPITRNNPRITYTEAGRKRAIDAAFITLRLARFKCDICGEPVESGDVVVVDRAHHACCGNGATGRVA